jgi:cbb3-type cytochrome oxidase subunit 3
VKLSDIMGYANLSVYAEVAMVIFLIVFVAIAVRLWLPGRQQALRDAARLPLDDDPTPAATPRGSMHG